MASVGICAPAGMGILAHASATADDASDGTGGVDETGAADLQNVDAVASSGSASSIYEINTWVWLRELSRKYRHPVTLADVPREEWSAIAKLGIGAVWLMGVWERSPAGIQLALNDGPRMGDFRRTLPDFRPDDVVGSPYCVRKYEVDDRLGGREGLAVARRELADRGMGLVLDYVPNHVAPDHPWTREHPEYFISGEPGWDPAAFIEIGGKTLARGKDPNYAPWPDVVQLNAFHPDLRQAAIGIMKDIAGQCDGIRVDLAMLFLNNTFERTWGWRVGSSPPTEFWREAIDAVRREYPGLLLLAEAYWDEWELMQHGFDACYDMQLYHRLLEGSAESIRQHLVADAGYQRRFVRFIENHDEPRVASIVSPERARAAAVAIATLPGTKLWHEGQFEGRRVRVPVFLGRRPEEASDAGLAAFYEKLRETVKRLHLGAGEFYLCHHEGPNLVAWCWRAGDKRHLIVLNFSDKQSQGMVRLPWSELGGHQWRLSDELSTDRFDRDGSQMQSPGLYVDLKPWGFHFLRFSENGR